MVTIQIDRLLSLCIERKAEDMYLYAGQPPRAWIDGAVRDLSDQRLDAADVETMIRTITPGSHLAALTQEGGTEFEFAYGDQARFAASIFQHEGKMSLDLRLIFSR